MVITLVVLVLVSIFMQLARLIDSPLQVLLVTMRLVVSAIKLTLPVFQSSLMLLVMPFLRVVVILPLAEITFRRVMLINGSIVVSVVMRHGPVKFLVMLISVVSCSISRVVASHGPFERLVGLLR